MASTSAIIVMPRRTERLPTSAYFLPRVRLSTNPLRQKWLPRQPSYRRRLWPPTHSHPPGHRAIVRCPGPSAMRRSTRRNQIRTRTRQGSDRCGGIGAAQRLSKDDMAGVSSATLRRQRRKEEREREHDERHRAAALERRREEEREQQREEERRQEALQQAQEFAAALDAAH